MSVSNTLNRVDNATTLQKFQEMFSCLTGLWVTFINSNAEFVSSVRGCRKFCVLMSEVEKERAVSRCWISNYNACQQVIQSQKPLIYECYAGLTEIIVPIIINDRSVGAVITGQIREKNNDPFDNKNISFVPKEYKDRLKKAIEEAPVFTSEQIQSCADLLSLLINGMVNNALGVQAFSDFNTPLSHSGSIVVQVTQYIKENYNDPDISLNKLAERLHISPFHLSRLLRRELDTTFIDYVTKIRLEETVRLLREQPSKSIKEIAFQIGYEDPYYFSKVFRKFYKISPLHFRKQFL